MPKVAIPEGQIIPMLSSLPLGTLGMPWPDAQGVTSLSEDPGWNLTCVITKSCVILVSPFFFLILICKKVEIQISYLQKAAVRSGGDNR